MESTPSLQEKNSKAEWCVYIFLTLKDTFLLLLAIISLSYLHTCLINQQYILSNQTQLLDQGKKEVDSFTVNNNSNNNNNTNNTSVAPDNNLKRAHPKCISQQRHTCTLMTRPSMEDFDLYDEDNRSGEIEYD